MFRELDVGQSALLTDIAMCINYYRLFSPGLYCCVHATVQSPEQTRQALHDYQSGRMGESTQSSTSRCGTRDRRNESGVFSTLAILKLYFTRLSHSWSWSTDTGYHSSVRAGIRLGSSSALKLDEIVGRVAGLVRRRVQRFSAMQTTTPLATLPQVLSV
jgi:hypothetical protein